MNKIYIIAYWDGEQDKILKAFYREKDADDYIETLEISKQFNDLYLYKSEITVE